MIWVSESLNTFNAFDFKDGTTKICGEKKREHPDVLYS